MNTTRFQKVLESGQLVKISNYNVTEEFRFAVNYTLTLVEMIAKGKYDWSNPDITLESFPIVGSGVVEYEACYFDFPDSVFSDDAIATIVAEDSTNPWEPAQIEHKCSFGAKFPEEQRKYSIVGLGSVAGVRGNRHVPCLWGDLSERNLDLYWFDRDDGWAGYYRFLAVRKVLRS